MTLRSPDQRPYVTSWEWECVGSVWSVRWPWWRCSCHDGHFQCVGVCGFTLNQTPPDLLLIFPQLIDALVLSHRLPAEIITAAKQHAETPKRQFQTHALDFNVIVGESVRKPLYIRCVSANVTHCTIILCRRTQVCRQSLWHLSPHDCCHRDTPSPLLDTHQSGRLSYRPPF